MTVTLAPKCNTLFHQADVLWLSVLAAGFPFFGEDTLPCKDIFMSHASLRAVPQSATRANRQLHGLDLLRFLAAMLVVFHHLGFWIWVKKIAPVDYYYLGPYTWSGWVGVEIFFVLSGFIIAYSAERADALSFLRSRAIRLYPAAMICSTATLLVLLLTHTNRMTGHLLYSWVNSFLLVPRAPWIDGSYWTLAVEVSFYALVFLLLLVQRFHWIDPVMKVIGIISSMSWIYIAAITHSWIRKGLFGKYYLRFFNSAWGSRTLADAGCFFTIGILLWLCLYHRATTMRIAVLLFCILGGMFEIEAHGSYFLVEAHAHYSKATPLLIWLVALSCIPAFVKYNQTLGRTLGNKGALLSRRLGLVTYPLYLIHQYVCFALIRKFLIYMPALAALLLAVAVALLSSLLINLFLEAPLQQRMRNFLSPKQRTAVTAVALT